MRYDSTILNNDLGMFEKAGLPRFEVLFRYLPGGTEEIPRKVKITGLPVVFELGTSRSDSE